MPWAPSPWWSRRETNWAKILRRSYEAEREQELEDEWLEVYR